MRGKMVDTQPAVTPVYSHPHRFERYNFTTPTYCDFCTNVLWGPVKVRALIKWLFGWLSEFPSLYYSHANPEQSFLLKKKKNSSPNLWSALFHQPEMLQKIFCFLSSYSDLLTQTFIPINPLFHFTILLLSLCQFNRNSDILFSWRLDKRQLMFHYPSSALNLYRIFKLARYWFRSLCCIILCDFCHLSVKP